MEHVIHNIPPVFDKNSKVLILGSMPSPKSRQAGFFYAHPQNRFWKILAAVFRSSVPSSNEEKKEFLLAHRIACWDSIAECDIVGASDSSVRNVIPNNFDEIFETADIQAVFTTGNTSYRYFKKFNDREAFKLPSPSAANCAVPFETLVREYTAILKYL